MEHIAGKTTLASAAYGLALGACLLSQVPSAAAAPPYKILDEKPKVIFYLSNSHKGYSELQEHLNHAGFPHIKVHNIPLAYKFKMDPKTGEFTGASFLERMLKTAKEKYPGHDMVMVRQGNSGAPFKFDADDPRTREKGAEMAEAKGWLVKSNGEYLALFRKKLMEQGFKDFYFYNHHYSKYAEKDNHPGHLDTIAELNKLVGYEVGIDCWPTTKPYYPRTVGFDYWHNNHFGKLAKTLPVMEAMARNSGVTDFPKLDLDEELKKFEAGHVKFLDITPVGKGQTYAVGDTVDLTWKVIDADLYPRVHLLLEVNGGRNKTIIATNVLSAQEHYRWTIEDVPVILPGERGRAAAIVSDQCRIRVCAALKKMYSVTAKAEGFFKIAPAGTADTDAPKLGPEPARLEDNLRKTGEQEYRIARRPGFYRAAIAIGIKDDGSPELLKQLEAMSRREHPDLVTVVATSQDAKRYDAMKKMGHEVVTKLPVKTGSTKTTYRVLPSDLGTVETYHFAKGSETAMRELIDKVLAGRSAAFVTYGERGDDFEAQIDALHDFHAELWNGPMNHLLRYVAQSRAAKLERVAFTAKNRPLELKLISTVSADAAGVPLWIQIPKPHWQWRPRSCTQGDQQRWTGEINGGPAGAFVRFTAVPNAGTVVLRP